MGSNTPGAASSAADLEAQEAPKSRPEPSKIDVEKTRCFWHRFFKGSDLVFEGFLDAFLKEKYTKIAKTFF